LIVRVIITNLNPILVINKHMRMNDIARPRLERVMVEAASPEQVTAQMRLVELPVEFLLRYAEKPDSAVVRHFVEKAHEGEFGEGGPIVLTIDHEGKPRVTKNPARLFAAKELDIPSVTAEVQWLGGSEEGAEVAPKDVTKNAVWG
jgi:hypothetical protein